MGRKDWDSTEMAGHFYPTGRHLVFDGWSGVGLPNNKRRHLPSSRGWRSRANLERGRPCERACPRNFSRSANELRRGERQGITHQDGACIRNTGVLCVWSASRRRGRLGDRAFPTSQNFSNDRTLCHCKAAYAGRWWSHKTLKHKFRSNGQHGRFLLAIRERAGLSRTDR